jgi:hypothetical protein
VIEEAKNDSVKELLGCSLVFLRVLVPGLGVKLAKQGEEYRAIFVSLPMFALYGS